MRKFSMALLVLVILSILLSACSQATPVPPTVEPTAVPTEPSSASGGQTETSNANFVCEPFQLLPEKRSVEEAGMPPITADDHSVGAEDALLTLVEYSDFQCPYCALAAEEVDKMLEQFPGQVRLVFRHFPLNIHDKANLASQATEAAANQGKFWEMYQAIFSGAREQAWQQLSVADFETYLKEQAATIGLDEAQFAEELNSDEVKARVEQDLQEAEAIGLNSTPSFYFLINDEVLFTPADGINWSSEILTSILKLSQSESKTYAECPPQVIDNSKEYIATLKTEKGDIVIRLLDDQAPIAVNSFVFLARDDYYDGVSFHRVLEGFVAQAGDPTGTGLGGPGYRFKNEVSPELTFDREGLLGMANSGVDTNGSQFFITYGPAPNLNGGYTIFGEVIEGMDVARSLTLRDPQQGGDLPEGDRILDVTIEEK